ncbi:hypothetical protein OsI_23542 [Oryza sativa Indica Group]|uniref:Uncharacterized protein n=1 Tax=Oryza sativa subsp. indica TaxID=39946 RepID=B8B460_ORYSI|nr:hypothetical protein OsI_23542 [Oryza sativa Indica Group]
MAQVERRLVGSGLLGEEEEEKGNGMAEVNPSSDADSEAGFITLTAPFQTGRKITGKNVHLGLGLHAVHG